MTGFTPVEVRCRVDPETQAATDKATISFKTMGEAEACVKTLNGRGLYGSIISLTMKGQSDPKALLHIIGLSLNITTQQLFHLFKDFGRLTSATVVSNKEKISKGFGFVQYEKAEEAEKAINQMDGAIINKQAIRVQVKGVTLNPLPKIEPKLNLA